MPLEVTKQYPNLNLKNFDGTHQEREFTSQCKIRKVTLFKCKKYPVWVRQVDYYAYLLPELL